MEKVRDVASALIDSTVRVIARDGLDKASVRTISSDCQVPNPYIYQFFKDKDDLLISTFTREERFRPLADAIHGCFDGTANVQALLQHILDNMMNLAMRVYSGELTDSDEARSHYFTLSLASVAPYLRMKDRRDAI